ncbi:transcriptional regulator [Morganella morganii]|uniref:substrate-binding domain-containing protein n=1 Tax=Morganella morganii TaxID=582 RepID=UPI00062C08F1|nr:substrate-binding domain-containing protein [Morganella morganii]EGT3622544.1 LacI family DNA-binding transcriptional regulator [Morganella morganii]EGT3630569.1 LacI family DNA-binding transcriptional regulator [Morganella morganii]EGT3633410.1 LacI family DNA-binding transcriptional regulator [Morganella morganii]EJD6037722.1 substrate-binding domain-containing protein [Morganella morganii]EKK5569708.1 substrate-binding domain-containing protein [Morganella morganii]
MATIKDVAKLAGVSVATVSRVINQSPKAGAESVRAVQAAMKELAYRPNAAARALVSQSSDIVGVLVGDVSDPFFGSLVKAADEVAHQHGKHLLIGNGYHRQEDERRGIELLMNSRCDACVIHAKALSDEELRGYAAEMPSMVFINRVIPGLENRCVALDNRRGSQLATQYLLKQGHRHIACLSSSHTIEDSTQRLAGYRDALAEAGCELPDAYIAAGEPVAEGGEAAMSAILSLSLPVTAVVAYNDFMAAGALSVIEANGLRAPEDISVIGFDDSMIARYIQPRLTTIRYPVDMMAQTATQLALALASSQTLPFCPPCYTPVLVLRHSVMSRFS